MSNTLLPCPFCGGEASVWDKSRYDICVRCDSCDAQVEWQTTKDKAIAAWSRRADAVPVVRGEWRWHEEWKESTSDGPAECQSAGYVCSACGIELSEYLSESLGEIIYADNPEETPKITFCPNCGAKMESEGGT